MASWWSVLYDEMMTKAKRAQEENSQFLNLFFVFSIFSSSLFYSLLRPSWPRRCRLFTFSTDDNWRKRIFDAEFHSMTMASFGFSSYKTVLLSMEIFKDILVFKYPSQQWAGWANLRVKHEHEHSLWCCRSQEKNENCFYFIFMAEDFLGEFNFEQITRHSFRKFIFRYKTLRIQLDNNKYIEFYKKEGKSLEWGLNGVFKTA